MTGNAVSVLTRVQHWWSWVVDDLINLWVSKPQILTITLCDELPPPPLKFSSFFFFAVI